MISLINVSKVYPDCTAVNGCSVQFIARGFHVVVGESGSGKTTLLNLMAMLDSPSSGEILYDSRTLLDEDDRSAYRRENMGYVFQDCILLSQLTVRENILLPLRLTGRETDEAYYSQLSNLLQISELSERRINEISAGQRQRVAFARALITKPKVLLADEPTANLDEKMSDEIFRLLKGISATTSVIAVTHDKGLARRYADRIIELVKGRIVSDEWLADNRSDDRDQVTSPSSAQAKAKSSTHFFSWADMKFKRGKQGKIVFVSIVAILMSCLGISFVRVSMSNNFNMEKYVLDTNLLTVKENMDSNVEAFLASYSGSDKFSTDCSFLHSDDRVEEVSQNYALIGFDIKGVQTIRLKNVLTINVSPYFESRLQSSRLTGSFLGGSEDIILAATVARSIFPDVAPADCIGREVIVSGTFFTKAFTVVGINNAQDASGTSMTYISVDAAKGLLTEESNSWQTSLELFTEKCYTVDNSVDTDRIHLTDSAKAMLLDPEDSNGVELLCGTNVLADGEIMVSAGLLRDFGQMFDLHNAFGVNASKKQMDGVISQRILCVANSHGYFRIVGIYNDPDNELSCIVNDSGRSQLMRVIPASLNVYVVDFESIPAIADLLESKGLVATSPYGHFKEMVGGRVSSVTSIFIVLVAVITLVAALVIQTLSKRSLMECVPDIGLLKAIGASRKDIVRIYVEEHATLGIVSGAASLMAYPFLIRFLNAMIESGRINVISEPLALDGLQVCLILALSVALHTLAPLASVMKYSRIDAIASIRKLD